MTPMTQAVGWALVHFLWQGTLVALGLAAGLSLLRARSASVRYAVSVGALTLLLALPVATALRSYPESVPAAGGSGRIAPAAPAQPVSRPAAAAAEVLPSAPTVRELLQPYLPSLLSVWIAGVAFLSIWHLGGWMQARRLTRRGTRPVEERWEMALVRLRRRLGIDKAVQILESSAVPVPAVVGWLKPVILVPASAFAGLTPQQLEAVLAHELAHVRRHDYLVNLLQAAVETLLFYHPAVWWVSRQVRQERECCCDDLAVAVCGDRLDYARALAALETLRTPRLVLGADGGSLLRRIRRIAGVQDGASRPPVAWMAGALTLALLATGAVFHEGARASLPLEIQVAPQAPQLSPQPPLSPAGTRIGPAASPALPAPPALLAQGPAAAPEPPSSSASRESTGQWTAERGEDGRIQLNMTYRHPGGGRSQHGNTYRESDFQGLGSGRDVRFELRRDAGTFTFEGRFDGTGPGSNGAGTFTFQGSPSYVREMAGLGYNVEAKDLFSLALFDVSRAFIAELRQLGYDDLSLEKLVEFRIHGVSPELVRAMAEAGYKDLTADKLVQLKIHGATPEFARGMAELGYGDVPLNRLVEFRIHGVSPEFVRSLAEAGHEGISAQDLVSMRIHNVTAQFVREAEKRAGRKLSEREIISRKISGRY